MKNKTIKESIETFAVRQVLRYFDEDPEKSFPAIMAWVDKFDTDDSLLGQRKAFHKNP